MSSKVGPEWANSLTRVRIFMKKYEIRNAMAATAAFSKKVPVAATALTTFYFFDPSNVLSPLWAPKGGQARGEFAFSLGTSEKSPPDVKKKKNENVTISLILSTFRSHFGARASNRKANRRSNRRSLAVAAVGRPERSKWGGQTITFSNENDFFENLAD